MYESKKVSPSDERIKGILRAGLPGYRGRRVRVIISSRGEPVLLHSYWDGGSRSVWNAVGVTPGCGVRVEQVPTWGGNYDRRANAQEQYAQPLGVVLVEHVQGSREMVYMRVREDDATLVEYLRPAWTDTPVRS